MASDMNVSMNSRRIPPHGTPESEFSIECFQNYTAPEVFVQGLAGLVNQGDVELMIRAQKQMLQRFEKTNEMLLNCNALSANRLKIASEEYKKHTKILHEMKKDLDYVFKKIRSIKSKISVQYPQAFTDIQKQQRNSFAEEAEDDEIATPSTSVQPTDIRGVASSPTMLRAKLKTQCSEKKKSNDSQTSTVSYVKMEQSPSDNGKFSTENVKKSEVLNRRSLLSNSSSTENSNDSSDCTTDTG